MSNPTKRWSWGGAFGRATGSGLGSAGAGALAGSLGGPLGVPAGAAIGGAFGFAGGFCGAVLGHWWDDMRRGLESFGSGALFTLTIGGTLSLVLVLSLTVHPSLLTLSMILFFSGFIGAALKSLLDDLFATYGGRPEEHFGEFSRGEEQ